MSNNLTQHQIDRRKRVGADLTRATSVIGLGSVAALGAGAAAPKLARAGKLARFGVNEAKATKFKEKTRNALIATGAVSGGISGINGFNNASWQSAEARQRKQKVVKSDTPSPFEDTAFMGEWSSAVEGESDEIAKALGQIKTPGMGAMRPSPAFKPMGQRPVSANVKNMRKVPLANGGPKPAATGGAATSTAGLSGVGKSAFDVSHG